jgi:hypothetical protein
MSNTNTFKRKIGGFERKNLKFAIGKDFAVGQSGTLYSTDAIIKGTLTIGSGNKQLIIGTNGLAAYIKYGKTDVGDLTNNGIYIGTDGIYLGTNGLWIDAAGTAHVKGAITATSLTLENTSINWNNVNAPTVKGYFDANGILHKGDTPSALPTAKGFSVDENGLLQASNAIIWGKIYTSEGQVGGWNVNGKGIYYG